MTIRMALVSCCGPKLAHAAPAKDLYCSPLFRFARNWAERNADGWFILSALHGVVLPDQIIAPYDQKMPARPDLRLAWGQRVTDQVLWRTRQFFGGDAATPPGPPVTYIALCGTDYTQHLELTGEGLAHRMERPLDGLMIGERLQWFKRQLETA